VSTVKYELGSYIPEDDILHSHCRENFKSYTIYSVSFVAGCFSVSGRGRYQSPSDAE
jgi:hypothetical protein